MRSVGVIVATYNRPEALELVLEGLAGQRRLPDQVVVADDGSDERTRACVQRYAKRSTVPVEHAWQPDLGFRLARIRNQAIQVCQCDYLIFLDGDCVPDPWFVEDHCHLARKNHFFQGKRILVDQKLTQNFNITQTGAKRWRLLLNRHLGNRHHLVRLPWIPPRPSRRVHGVRGCNMGFFREDLVTVNGFNEAFQGWGREDSELAVRLYKYGLRRLDHAFAAICFHLWHPECSRGQLDENDRLLAAAMAQDAFFCPNGIHQTRQPGRELSERNRGTP